MSALQVLQWATVGLVLSLLQWSSFSGARHRLLGAAIGVLGAVLGGAMMGAVGLPGWADEGPRLIAAGFAALLGLAALELVDAQRDAHHA